MNFNKNELFTTISDTVGTMDSKQLRQLAVGSYLEVRDSFMELGPTHRAS